MRAANANTAHIENVATHRATSRIIRLLSPGPALTLHTEESFQRRQLEKYIADQFRKVHNAEIHEYLPYLLSLSCAGNITAAAGIRPARGQMLFLERYLPGSAEQMISNVDGRRVARWGVAEIGNLAATQRGFSQLLFLLLTAVLQKTRFEWVVFTATPVVQKTLNHLGVPLHTLGKADPLALNPRERSNWGGYYDCVPHVVAGHVATGMTALSERRRHAAALAMYGDRIEAVAAELNQQRQICGTHSFAA